MCTPSCLTLHLCYALSQINTSPHDIKAYRGIWSILLLTLKRSTKWIEWAASGSVCFNPEKRNPCNLLKMMLDEPRASHNVLEKTKNTLLPARISSPDSPACGLITMHSMLSCPPLLSSTFNKIFLGWQPCQLFKSLSSVILWPCWGHGLSILESWNSLCLMGYGCQACCPLAQQSWRTNGLFLCLVSHHQPALHGSPDQ